MARTPKQTIANILAAQRRIEAAETKRRLTRKTGTQIAKEKSEEKRKESRDAHKSTTGLSAKFMIRETAPRTRELMNKDNVQIVKMVKSKSGRSLLSQTASAKRDGVNYYKQAVTNLDPNEPKFSLSKNLVVECNCLAGDTKVLTEDGWKTLYELAEPYTGDASVNYIVNGKIYKGTAPYFKGLQKSYKIVLSNGEEIVATKEHKFLRYTSICRTKTTEKDPVTGKQRGVYERKETKKWTTLKNLNVGDKLCLTNDKNKNFVEYNSDFYEAFFIGIIMGDGSIFSDGRPDLKLYGNKKELLPYLLSMDIVGSVRENSRKATQVIFTHRGKELLNKYKYINKKSVCIKNREQLYGYLSGLASTDGSINKELQINGAGEYLTQLRDYLIQYGLSDLVLKISRRAGIETSTIEGKTLKSTKDMYHLRIKTKSLAKANLLLVGKRKEAYKAVLKKIQESNIVKTPYTSIISISYNGKNWVYDITIPGKKCFVVNGGVIAHNCSNFKYERDYALHEKGASELKYSTDEPPDVTNPKRGGKRRLGICIGKGQLIHTKRGLVPIEEITLNDKVYTLKGFKKVVSKALTEKKAEVVKVRTRSSTELVLTPEHLVYVLREGDIRWVTAGELTSKDYIVTLLGAKKTIIAPLHEEKLAEIMGYMVAEGWQRNFTTSSKKIRDHFLYLHNSLYPSVSYVKMKHKKNEKIISKKVCYNIKISKECMSDLYNRGFIDGSYKKEIPKYILESNNSTVRGFIRGIYAGDGWISESGVTYGSCSKKLAYQLKHLLATLGYRATVDENISGVNSTLMYLVRFSDSRQCLDFGKWIDPIRGINKPKKRRSLTKNNSIVDFIPIDSNELVKRELKNTLRKFVYKNNYLLELEDVASLIKELEGRHVGYLVKKIVKRLGNDKIQLLKQTNGLNKKLRLAYMQDIWNCLVPEITEYYCDLWRKSSPRNKKCVVTKIKSDLRIQTRNFTISGPGFKFKEALAKLSILGREDVYFDRVKSVHEDDNVDVYDLTVKDAEHFLVNSSVVHNCKHLLLVLSDIVSSRR